MVMRDGVEAVRFEQHTGSRGQVRVLENTTTQHNGSHIGRPRYRDNPIGQCVMELRSDAGHIETRLPIQQERLDQWSPIADAVSILDLVTARGADTSDGAFQAHRCLSFEAVPIGYPTQAGHRIEQAADAR